MKKIFFNIMTALVLLSLIMLVSCRAEPFDRNNPDRPRIPMTAYLAGPDGIVDQREVVFTASAEFAQTFEWRRGGVVLQGETSNTLHVFASGFFPDMAPITVSGVNQSGIGAMSDTLTISFLPWEVPGEAILEGDTNVPNVFFENGILMNECPALHIDLVARIWQATIFEWYRDGIRIVNPAGPGSPVLRITDTVENPERSGRYTVRGRNMLGESLMSNHIDVAWTFCDITDLTGPWAVAGRHWWWGNNPTPWRSHNWADTIVPHATLDNVLFARNFGGLSGGAINGNIFFRIHQNSEGRHFIINNEHIGNDQNGAAHLLPIVYWEGDQSPSFLGAANFPIYLEVSADGNSFRLPPALPIEGEDPITSIGIVVGVRNPQGAVLGYYTTTIAFDFIFTRVGATSSTQMVQDIEWIPVERQTVIRSSDIVPMTNKTALTPR